MLACLLCFSSCVALFSRSEGSASMFEMSAPIFNRRLESFGRVDFYKFVSSIPDASSSFAVTTTLSLGSSRSIT
jgi:hypothetical protein